MRTQKFSKIEAIRFGWNTVKNNLVFIMVLSLVSLMIAFALSSIRKLAEEVAPDLLGIVWVLKVVFLMAFGMGFIKIALNLYDKKKAKFADLFSCFPLLPKCLFSLILSNLIFFVGMILLIIPGIIWSIELQFLCVFIVDKGLGPIEALEKSSLITSDTKWDLFLFDLLLIFINLLGVALILLLDSINHLLGVFFSPISLSVTSFTTLVALVFVYRKLLAQVEIVQTPKRLTGEDIL